MPACPHCYVIPVVPADAAAVDVVAAALIREKTSKCLQRIKVSTPATCTQGPLPAWAL